MGWSGPTGEHEEQEEQEKEEKQEEDNGAGFATGEPCAGVHRR